MIKINSEKAAEITKSKRRKEIHQSLNKVTQEKIEAERENNNALIIDLSAQKQKLIDELRNLLL